MAGPSNTGHVPSSATRTVALLNVGTIGYALLSTKPQHLFHTLQGWRRLRMRALAYAAIARCCLLLDLPPRPPACLCLRSPSPAFLARTFSSPALPRPPASSLPASAMTPFSYISHLPFCLLALLSFSPWQALPLSSPGCMLAHYLYFSYAPGAFIRRNAASSGATTFVAPAAPCAHTSNAAYRWRICTTFRAH